MKFLHLTTKYFGNIWLLIFIWSTVHCEERKLPNGECPSGSFPCNTTDLCIPQRHWCDESVHCADGSDEASCVDDLQDELINRKYRKRPGAIIDELPKYCHFDVTNPLNVTKSTVQCQCFQASILCRHLQLELAPNITKMFDIEGKTIELLDLGGNSFTHPNYSTFESLHHVNIINLVLQHCKIKQLNQNCFDDILHNGLQELHLDGNHLVNLQDNVFNGNNISLRLLSLGHNSITSIDPDTFQHLRQLIELNLSHNQIKILNANWFRTLYNLKILNLQGNLLTNIEISSWLTSQADLTFKSNSTINKVDGVVNQTKQHTLQAIKATKTNETIAIKERKGLSKLEWLLLANNHIRNIQDDAFNDAPMAHSLVKLDFSENDITTLSNQTFKGLASLLVLKLNQNNLQQIHPNVFVWMVNLTSLDLQNNNKLQVSQELFRPLTQLHHLYFDTFEMCASAPFVKVCEPKGDGISSKEHLLDSIILRTSVWIMALIGFIGNSIVILGRQFVTRHSNVVDSLHIKNLAVSDLLMSLYLFGIATVDEHYRGEYLLNEILWRQSNWCTLSGFLNTLSCESSVFILSLVTWDRYVSVTRPFPRNQLNFKYAALRLMTLWVVAIMIAYIPILQTTRDYFGFEFYNSNGLCLPLYLHNPYGKGWQYSIITFVCINFVALGFICFAYLKMIKAIRVSTVACRSTQHTQDRDRVAQHLGIIVFTDCLCWIPIIAIKMATLAGLELNQTYRNFVYASLAIYIMPINSALNPILYTFATPLFKQQICKMALLCFKRRREGQSGYDTALSLSLGIFGSSGKRMLTYRSTQTSLSGSKNSCWRKQPQSV